MIKVTQPQAEPRLRAGLWDAAPVPFAASLCCAQGKEALWVHV